MRQSFDFNPNAAQTALQDQFRQNETILEGMKERIEALKHSQYEILQRINTASHIMSKFSPELLSEIFFFACPDNWSTRRTPRQFILGRVCKAWRHIAWTTPKLWTTVRIRFSPERFETQRHLVEEWVKRSGEYPLELYFDVEYAEIDGDWEPSVDSKFRYLMETTHRWTRFESPAFPSLARALEQCRAQFDLLDTLHLKNRDHPYLTEWNFRSATPRLQFLDILTLRPTADLLVGVNWENLVVLRISLDFRFRPNIKILASLPSLECLSAYVTGDSMYFDLEGLADPNLPNLLSLSLKGKPEAIVLALNLMKTPNLRKLQVDLHDTHHQAMWTAAIADLVKRSSCHLTELTLNESNECDERLVLAMLSKIGQSLESLHLTFPEPFTLSDLTFNTLNLTPHSKPKRQQQCVPNLKAFSYTGHISFTLHAVLQMLKSRRPRRDVVSDSEEETDSGDEIEDTDDESPSDAEDEVEGNSGTSTPASDDDFEDMTLVEDLSPRSRPDFLSICITYSNLPWYQEKNPNKMWAFVEKVKEYAADGIFLNLNWEEPESEIEG